MTCLEVIYHIQKDSWSLDDQNPPKKWLTFLIFHWSEKPPTQFVRVPLMKLWYFWRTFFGKTRWMDGWDGCDGWDVYHRSSMTFRYSNTYMYSKSTFGANNYLLFNHNVHQIKQIFSCFLYIFKLNTLFHFSLHVFKSNRYFIVQLIFSRVSQKLFLFLTFSR